jgi:UDP-glucose 4-epimerase
MMNAATGARYTLRETFDILKDLTGFKGDPVFAEARAGDIRHSHADISRIKELLGYEPKVSFREALRRTVEWYRAGA